MPNLGGYKARISSAQDITKITGAMELVATAKLKRVGKRVGETHIYLTEVYNAFNEIIKNVDNSIFLAKDDQKFEKTLWVVVNSNLGLCGAYNANINKLVMQNIKKTDSIYAIGKKAVSFFSARHMNVIYSDLTVDVNFSHEQAGAIGRNLLELFSSKQYDEIKLVYTKFINNVTFEPTILRLFPIVKEKKVENDHTITAQVEFEPDAETILSSSVGLYLNTILLGTIVESQVSEQASRRTAMEAATKNGRELVRNWIIQFNRVRQSVITQEITEIVSGANA
ncbi:ATP synthase F1 subunit gamma [Spiroplasma endosymbiont of Labia minor]|uniref:ATP synthase F1 subunit gamma n=1 Tax=Spiroplasma endosymbiont of Labia minor TaxID=3066305 RepID=UPI0030CFCB5F